MKRSAEKTSEDQQIHYVVCNESAMSEEHFEHLMHHATSIVPSAFNTQATRLVLLTGKPNQQFWSLVRDTLQALIPEEIFAQTRLKIDQQFANSYGTILFFEDQEAVEKIKKNFSRHKESFRTYANHTSAMHQLALWLMFEDEGLGVSIQHYNLLIGETIREAFALPRSWKFIVQMPLENPTKAIPETNSGLTDSENIRIIH